MGKLIDLTGQNFGLWKVIERAQDHIKPNKKKEVVWKCQCGCENKTIALVMGQNLRKGVSRSCGCAHKEIVRELFTKHGESDTRLYRIWQRLIDRCTNPNNPRYESYGGRGIEVCKEWEDSFEIFFDWSIVNGYQENLSIDRIDNNSGYRPMNCRWATDITQQNNKRNNRYLSYNGEIHTVAEWSRILNINYKTLINRVCSGWSDEKCLSTPVMPRNKPR